MVRWRNSTEEEVGVEWLLSGFDDLENMLFNVLSDCLCGRSIFTRSKFSYNYRRPLNCGMISILP